METITIPLMSIGFSLLFILLFLRLLIDCRKRNEHDFPYGGNVFSQRTMKWIWTGILVFFFLLSLAVETEKFGTISVKVERPNPETDEYSKYMSAPFIRYEETSTGKPKTYSHSISLRFPWLWLIGMGLYYVVVGVKRWPKGQG
jgi:hypothetical protein